MPFLAIYSPAGFLKKQNNSFRLAAVHKQYLKPESHELDHVIFDKSWRATNIKDLWNSKNITKLIITADRIASCLANGAYITAQNNIRITFYCSDSFLSFLYLNLHFYASKASDKLLCKSHYIAYCLFASSQGLTLSFSDFCDL